MVSAETKNVLKGALDRYYSMLFSVGYVRHELVKRLLAAAFILAFIDKMDSFINQDEYSLISEAYKKLSLKGGCILPYSQFKLEKHSYPKDRSYWDNSYIWIHEI